MFTDCTIGTFVGIPNDLKQAVRDYQAIRKEADDLGVDIGKTIYGNIDTNNRQVLEWTEENLHEKLEAFRALYKEKGVKPKVSMWAIRAAVTGRTCGADMTAILAIIGKDKTFNRVKNAMKQTV